MDEDARPADSGTTSRRSGRVLLNVPVIVQGEGADSQPFQEETHTLVVNVHGALITLATRVEEGKELAVTNKNTQHVEVCRVTYLGPTHAGKTQVGIEFRRPAPNFWQILFPPET